MLFIESLFQKKFKSLRIFIQGLDTWIFYADSIFIMQPRCNDSIIPNLIKNFHCWIFNRQDFLIIAFIIIIMSLFLLFALVHHRVVIMRWKKTPWNFNDFIIKCFTIIFLLILTAFLSFFSSPLTIVNVPCLRGNVHFSSSFYLHTKEWKKWKEAFRH